MPRPEIPAAPDRALEASPRGETHQALIDRLYREHNQALVNFLLTRVGSEAEARDVAQEAYVRMLQLDRKGAVSFLCGYLFKTAANIAVDRARSRMIHRRVTDGIQRAERQGEASPPERQLEAQEEIELIERYVQELPARCRQAFYLHRLHDMSPPDIASRLGVSKRMVHLYLVQALAHLRSRLDSGARAKDDAHG